MTVYTADRQDSLLEDLITYSDLLFGADDNGSAPAIFPPESALSRSGAISYQPVEDGLHPGSSRTKFMMVTPEEEKPEPTPAAAIATLSAIPTGVIGLGQSASKSMSPAHGAPGVVSMPPPTFTQDKQLDLLFDPKDIPQSLRDVIGSDFHVSWLMETLT